LSREPRVTRRRWLTALRLPLRRRRRRRWFRCRS
jgi:hypothetical protein